MCWKGVLEYFEGKDGGICWLDTECEKKWILKEDTRVCLDNLPIAVFFTETLSYHSGHLQNGSYSESMFIKTSNLLLSLLMCPTWTSL